MIHGQADFRVEYDYQYQPLIRALKRHDKTHETLVKRYEGHGFYREQNQIELYGRIERFLDEYMPAGLAPDERVAER